jgi:DNA repair protein RecN (Recombination protein N)
LEEANLQSGEQQELEHELGLLSNAEEIKQQLYAVAYHFAEGDTNLLSLLQENVNRLLQISKYDEGIEELSKRLQSQIIELKDIVFEIHKINENTQHNPQRIEQINQRLDVLYTLQQKHKVSAEADLMAIQNHLAEVLERIEHAEEEKQHMLLQIENEKQILYQKATLLSDKRKAVLKKMETDLQHVLQVLHMPSAHFDIRMEKSEHFHAAGLDKVVFWFTANPGTEMQTLEKSASGGELSRVMLALKSLISEKNVLPTIIFDEIDSGVSGEISAKMGKVMQKLATYSQIIAISHVPQIAAKAKNHYVVFKEVIKGETYSNIKKLTHLEHISEIAKMISNEKITESSLSAAKQLING